MKKFTQLSELSTELLARYKKKASTQASQSDKTAFSGKVSSARAQELLNKSNKRYRGIIKATGKQFANDTKKRTNEEVEQIDELSKGTLRSYQRKATTDVVDKLVKAKEFGDIIDRIKSRPVGKVGSNLIQRASRHQEKTQGQANKRSAGLVKAATRLKEDVEQIDELSKQTLTSYMSSAKKGQKKTMSNILAGSQNKKTARDYTNRTSGIIKARERLKTEEVEQIDELSKETLISYKKKRIGQRMTRDLRWKDNSHPDVKKAIKAEKGIDKATKKLEPIHKKAEEERNKKLAAADKANRSAHEAEMKKIKAEYERHHGPIEQGNHQYSGRAHGSSGGGYRQGKELFDRYHNLKKRISEETIAESAKPNEIHVSEVGGGKYKVHAVGSKFAHGIKVGEHLNDTHLDDFNEMGGKIKYVKQPKKD